MTALRPTLIGLAVAVVIAYACSTRCESGAVCGTNAVGPTTVITTTTTTTASPTPSATPGCVAQTGGFVCTRGPIMFEAILLDVQRSIPAAPEPIYVAALVRALNQRPDICAIAGPSPDEVTIKARESNAVSSTIDVVNKDGTIQAIAPPLNICSPSRF